VSGAEEELGPGSPPLTVPDARDAAVAGALLDRARRVLAAPLALYVATALLQFLVLWLMLGPGDGGVRGKLLSWDGQWYVDVARHGYPHGLQHNDDGSVAGSTLAFFPLYPALIRFCHDLTGLGEETSALTVSRLAGAAAAVVVFHLVARLYDRRAALVVTVLACAQPMAVSLSMAYTEGLFLALAAGALLAAHREAWLAAGVCGLLAGLTRSTAVAVSAALVVAAVAVMWRRRAVEWRAVAGCAIGSCGVPVYLLWVAHRTGRLDGWTVIQRAGWNTRWDWGVQTWRFLSDTFQHADGWVAVSTALLLVATAVASVVAAAERVWPPLVVYGVLVLALTVGQTNYYHSKPRLLVPALLALLPLGVSLSRARPATAVLATASFALFGTWYGAYMLTAWHYAV
jgi:Dolichyl-phosphate-mannose-protein mannosyltransferase